MRVCGLSSSVATLHVNVRVGLRDGLLCGGARVPGECTPELALDADGVPGRSCKLLEPGGCSEQL